MALKPKLHHVTIKTSHLDAMVNWYADVVGAEVQYRDPGAVWMTNDGANHRIAFLAFPGLADDPQKAKHNGMHHTAFEYESFADLMSTFDRLRAKGILPAFCLDHAITISNYYKDPEGNYVELQCDAFSNWKESSEFMRSSPVFAANPIGHFFDPARVYADFQAGKDLVAIQRGMQSDAYLPNPVPDIG